MGSENSMGDVDLSPSESPKLPEAEHYVYLHREKEEVLYVGLGKDCRAFRSVGSGHRDKEHAKWLSSKYRKGICPVYFAKVGLTKKQALMVESNLIKKYKPKFNKVHNPNYSFRRVSDILVSFAKLLRSQGYSYTQISYLMGGESLISRENTKTMSIWRLVNE